MRAHGLSAPNRPPQRPANDHAGTIPTDAVDEARGTDTAQTIPSCGARVHIFAAVDHGDSACIGLHAARAATRRDALAPVRRGVGWHVGPAVRDIGARLGPRHDLGSNDMAADLRREIAFVGIEASRSLVRAPEGDGVAERVFRTLKEQLLRGRPSQRSRRSRRRCGRSRPGTTRTGWSSVTPTAHPIGFEPIRNPNPWPKPSYPWQPDDPYPVSKIRAAPNPPIIPMSDHRVIGPSRQPLRLPRRTCPPGRGRRRRPPLPLAAGGCREARRRAAPSAPAGRGRIPG